MNKSLALVAVLCLSTGCAMTPRQRTIAIAVGTVVVVGAIAVAAHDKKDSPPPVMGPICYIQPNGTCR